MRLAIRSIFHVWVLLALILSQCKVGPNYQSAVVDTPDHFRFDQNARDTVVNLEWWELFQDQTLQGLVRVALQENLDLRFATSRIQEARAYSGFTKADLYPKFNIEGSATSNNINFGTNEEVDNRVTYLAAPSLSWELDFWGKFQRSNEAAQAEVLATEYGRRQVQISLISEVVMTYFQILDFSARVEISQRTAEVRKEFLAIIEDRHNEGTVAEIEVNPAQVQLATAEATIPRHERNLARAEHTLSILLGRNPGGFPDRGRLQDQVLPPNIPPGIPATLLARRPDILQAEQYVHAQTARIGVAEAMRLPSISLTGMLGAASPDLIGLTGGNSVIWSAGAGLFAPLFHFGKNKRRVEIEKFRTEQALVDYEQTVLFAFQEVEDALVEIDTYTRELEARIRQVRAAGNVASLSRARYDGGVTSYLEVLESERSFFNAELGAAGARRSQLESYVRLYKALGGGWISQADRDNSGRL